MYQIYHIVKVRGLGEHLHLYQSSGWAASLRHAQRTETLRTETLRTETQESHSGLRHTGHVWWDFTRDCRGSSWEAETAGAQHLRWLILWCRWGAGPAPSPPHVIFKDCVSNELKHLVLIWIIKFISNWIGLFCIHTWGDDHKTLECASEKLTNTLKTHNTEKILTGKFRLISLHLLSVSTCLSPPVCLHLSVSTCLSLPVCLYLPVPTCQSLPVSPYLTVSTCLSLPVSPYLSISTCLPVCLHLSVSACLSLPVSPYLPVPTCQSLPVSPYLTVSTCLSLPVSPYLSVSTCQSLPVSPYLSISTCLPVYLSISTCLPVCLHLSVSTCHLWTCLSSPVNLSVFTCLPVSLYLSDFTCLPVLGRAQVSGDWVVLDRLVQYQSQ